MDIVPKLLRLDGPESITIGKAVSFKFLTGVPSSKSLILESIKKANCRDRQVWNSFFLFGGAPLFNCHNLKRQQSALHRIE
jgi:hypothetical protein